jgi:galactokinase/mevalonate kinase-like predicted kinase
LEGKVTATATKRSRRKSTNPNKRCDRCYADASILQNGEWGKCHCGALIHGRSGYTTTIIDPKQKEVILANLKSRGVVLITL